MTHCCPICRTPTSSGTHADFPFCSERCRLLDLGNWASEKYRITRPVIDEDALDSVSGDDSAPGTMKPDGRSN